MKKPENPCTQACPLRKPGCREDCFDFIMYEIKLKYWRDAEAVNLRGENDYFDYVGRSVDRLNRRRGRK